MKLLTSFTGNSTEVTPLELGRITGYYIGITPIEVVFILLSFVSSFYSTFLFSLVYTTFSICFYTFTQFVVDPFSTLLNPSKQKSHCSKLLQTEQFYWHLLQRPFKGLINYAFSQVAFVHCPFTNEKLLSAQLRQLLKLGPLQAPQF